MDANDTNTVRNDTIDQDVIGAGYVPFPVFELDDRPGQRKLGKEIAGCDGCTGYLLGKVRIISGVEVVDTAQIIPRRRRPERVSHPSLRAATRPSYHAVIAS